MSAAFLLSRQKFAQAVFERDMHTCVFCSEKAVDAHHVLERRLFPDGGYYLDNGISVCARHHLECEETSLTVEDARRAAGIRRVIVPPHLYPDQPYDKWGNPVLENGTRLRGELFYDESVQKILGAAGMLDLFTCQVKYPRTYHLPWSEGISDDDRIQDDLSGFVGRRVIVTEKMDGENTSLYRDYIHARSLDGRSHPSRDWVKRFRATIAADIPICAPSCGRCPFLWKWPTLSAPAGADPVS